MKVKLKSSNCTISKVPTGKSMVRLINVKVVSKSVALRYGTLAAISYVLSQSTSREDNKSKLIKKIVINS